MTTSQTNPKTNLPTNLRSMASALAGKTFAGHKAIVCLYMDSGMDSNDVLIPCNGSGKILPEYVNGRGVLGRSNGAVQVHDDYYMPADFTHGNGTSGKSIIDLFVDNKLKVISNIGTLTEPYDFGSTTPNGPLHLQAHDMQKQQWLSGISDEPALSVGWGGSMLAQLGLGLDPIGVPHGFSVGPSSDLLVGAEQMQLNKLGAVEAKDLTTGPNEHFGNLMTDLLTKDTTNHVFAQDYAERFMAAQTAAVAVNDAIKTEPILPADPVLADDLTLQESFKSIVRTMLAARNTLNHKRQIFYVETTGSWDTHGGQKSAFDTKLKKLSAALGYFYEMLELNGLHDEVVTFTASDFSRSFVPNSAELPGTDHAWGGQTMVMASPQTLAQNDGIVSVGPMHDFVPGGYFDESSNGHGSWIPTTSVVQLAATLGQWFGVANADLPSVFSNLGNFADHYGQVKLLDLFQKQPLVTPLKPLAPKGARAKERVGRSKERTGR